MSDVFGVSVALDGDTALVGAYGDDNYVGSAYVFTRDANGVWTQQARLSALVGELNDAFGLSVALDGDTALVGAWRDDYVTGSAYVFSLTEITTAPTLVCLPSTTVKLDLTNGSRTLTTDDLVNEVSNNFGMVMTSLDVDTFTAADLGTTIPVTVSAVDISGNQTTCTVDVFVTSVLDVIADGQITPADALYVIDRLGGSDMDADVDGVDGVTEAVLGALGTDVTEMAE